MKKIINIFAIFGIFACCKHTYETPKLQSREESKKINHTIAIKHYVKNTAIINLDSVKITEINNKEHSFIYNYMGLEKFSDTLVMYKDSINMNGEKLNFIDKKVMNSGNSKLIIYKYYKFSPRASTTYFISNKDGIILNKTNAATATIFTEYDYNKNSLVIQEIFADSTFLFSNK